MCAVVEDGEGKEADVTARMTRSANKRTKPFIPDVKGIYKVVVVY